MILSVIIPAFNEEKTIERVISSIKKLDLKAQGISGKEIIVIDDGSSDRTLDIAKKASLLGLIA